LTYSGHLRFFEFDKNAVNRGKIVRIKNYCAEEVASIDYVLLIGVHIAWW